MTYLPEIQHLVPISIQLLDDILELHVRHDGSQFPHRALDLLQGEETVTVVVEAGW